MQFQFDSFAEWMSMAGHGPYVWFCYALTFVSLVYLLVGPLRRRRALQRELLRMSRIAERSAPVSSQQRREI